MFEGRPTYNPYRALHWDATTPVLVGEDVYALQKGLNAVGDFKVPLTPDGVLGPKTGKATIAVQKSLNLEADGVAGQLTQRGIALWIGKRVKGELPPGLPLGQLQHESSFLLGNYSILYHHTDGSTSFDQGVAQRNTRYTDGPHGFDPVDSITALCARVTQFHDQYTAISGRRRWELAVGAWNAWAYSNWIAWEEGQQISAVNRRNPDLDGARAKFEEYMDSCCAYLQI